jgi:lysophospholipase L1-like esterase
MEENKMIFEESDTLVMAGDSVTDCDRMYNMEPGCWGSFGDGYVRYVDGFLSALYPELKVLVANRGVSGNIITDVEERWDKDVLALNPDWVSLMIGINDVWRQFDGVVTKQKTVLIDEFEACYRRIIEKTKDNVKGMILITPIMMESNPEHPMKKTVYAYGEVAKRLADEYGLIFVDAQKKVDDFLTKLNEYVLTSDRVHPNHKGHAIIAKAFLDAVGTDWSR